MKCKQNATDTKSERNVTKAEQSLLETLLNPENRMKSVVDICKIAKVDRATYYRAFQKTGFVELYKQRSKELVDQSVASVINTFIREAQRGSFQHGKVILEMAGIYKDKIEISGKINNPMEGLTTEELKKLIQDE
jgi:hypothetical protein